MKKSWPYKVNIHSLKSGFRLIMKPDDGALFIILESY